MIKRDTLIKTMILLGLTLAAYIPTFVWMFDRWFEAESYYGHGFLIPLVSAYIAWQKRHVIKRAKISSDRLGLPIIIIGLLIHVVSALLKVYFLSGYSFVLVLYGILLFSFGREVTRNFIFPVLFLLAMIPLPLVIIGNLTVKLKLFVAEVATFVLNRIGFPSVRDGSIIRMPSSYIIVEAPCSGLRSLISLITLGLLFAYAIKATPLKKCILFLSSIPIALFTNLIRITLLAVVNDLYGEKIALGLFHDFSGFLVFGIAFIGLYGVSRTLEQKKT